MQSYQLAKRYLFKTASVLVIAPMSAHGASAVKFPSKKNRYMTKPLQVCDQGLFYVGGAPKLTAFGAGPTAGAVTQIIIGSMFVQFQIPMKSKTWPLIMVHGSGYNGSCVQGTAGGTEGWADYTVRAGIPTYVVDQSGRARSGFDKSVIHEGESLIATDPLAAAVSDPDLRRLHQQAWNSWFGHIVPSRYRHHHRPDGRSATASPRSGPAVRTTEPAHCKQLGRIPMEPEAPWAVDQAVASRTVVGAPAGTGNRRSGSRRPRQRGLPAE